ncbi:PREDICTED: monocarboxylate transporter 12-like, partial [Priapulus caudatus]|uniref:Monocarboxylate transporter 12-like n=1 Tax=Priapulus caudatus TaxID=37621 RepID=A0ABM1F2W9_PRICU
MINNWDGKVCKCAMSFSLTSDYFDKRAATASGIVVAGAGVGGLVLPLIANALVAEYTYTGASLINGAIVLHTAACAALLRPLPTRAATRTDAGVTFTRFETAPSAYDLTAVADAVAKQQPRHAFRWSALADARFWVFTLCMCLLNFGLFNIAVYLPIKSIEIGGEDANTALAVSVSSATDTLARLLLCAVLWDSKHFRGIYTRQMG